MEAVVKILINFELQTVSIDGLILPFEINPAFNHYDFIGVETFLLHSVEHLAIDKIVKVTFVTFVDDDYEYLQIVCQKNNESHGFDSLNLSSEHMSQLIKTISHQFENVWR
jgi:hypothetical protein